MRTQAQGKCKRKLRFRKVQAISWDRAKPERGIWVSDIAQDISSRVDRLECIMASARAQHTLAVEDILNETLLNKVIDQRLRDESRHCEA